MTSAHIRQKYLRFFQSRGHAIIPSAPLVPENDPTTLFTSSGMQPLVPYLLGQPHPLGKRLVNSQKSFRAQDIDEVGDCSHTTFFEMLGNWSLGDYFKKEQLPWFFEFLTKELGLDPKRLYVSVFEGEGTVPKDVEAINIWKETFALVGIEAKEGERIFTYPSSKNWWSRSGEPEKMPPGEPGGPDSEVFFDFGQDLAMHEKSAYKNQKCHPNCQCGRFMEIGNSVFMQYQKPAFVKTSTFANATVDKSQGQESANQLIELKQKNVDFGGGLERLNAAVADTPDIFTTDSFSSIVDIIELLVSKQYGTNEAETRSMRIIADHMRGAVMMMSEGIIPSNKAQGYVLRRLIRRLVMHGKKLGFWGDWKYLNDILEAVAKLYSGAYPEVTQKQSGIQEVLKDEIDRFGRTIDKGLKEIEKMPVISGKQAFFVYESYGFPWELTEEIAKDKGQKVDRGQFEEEFKKHQELSRTAAAGMFKGGLADKSEQVTKLHTSTHLLHAALRQILGTHVAQKGSNITAERLRFDFSHPSKLTTEELKQIEDLVNQKIKENLAVSCETMDKDEAIKSGAMAFFGQKYADKVKVYKIGPSTKVFSREICGGPHVNFTGSLGHFTINKEESAGAGIRRIYASLK